MKSKRRYSKLMYKGISLLTTAAVMAGMTDVTAFAATLPEDEAITLVSVSDGNQDTGVWRFDFGTATSPVQEGWTQITKDTEYAYSEAVGYGWLTHPDKEWEYTDTEVTLPDELSDLMDVACDRLRGSAEYEFAVDVPNGEYDVVVYGGYPNNTSKLPYTIEGTKLGWQTVSTFTGVAQTVTVEDGQLNVVVRNDGGTPDISGLMVTQKQTQVETLAAPTNLAYEVKTETTTNATISFTFDAVEGAASYKLYQGESEVATLTTNSYEMDVVKGAKYTYYVTAVAEDGTESEASDTVEVNLTEGGTDTTGQTEWYFDFGQSTSAVQDGWVKITKADLYDADLGYGWNTAPNNIDYVQTSPDETIAEELQDVAVDMIRGDNTWDFAVDVPNGQYEVTVYAGYPANTKDVNYSVEEDKILKTRFTTFDSIGGTVIVEDGQLNLKNISGMSEIRGLKVVQTLAPPTKLAYVIESKTSSHAKVNFTFEGIEEAVSYKLYQSSSVGDGEKVEIDEFEDTKYTMDVMLGETYEFYVTAITEDGTETVASNVIEVDLVDSKVSVPSAPQNVEVEESKTSAMKLVWDAADSSENVFAYNIYRSQKMDAKDYKLVGTTTTNSFTDTDEDVTANVNWYYKVQAQNAGGVSALSEIVTTEITEELVPIVADWYDRAPVAIDLAGSKGQDVDVYVSATDKDGNEYEKGVYLSWRSYEEDFNGLELTTTFDIYRNGTLIGEDLSVTNLIDEGGKYGDTYRVVGSNDKSMGLVSKEISVWENQYLELQLVKPDKQTMPDGEISDYVPNDTMLADLNGDGDLELVVKWRPRNFKDNGFSGYSATTFYDGYDVDFSTGEVTMLWRIDMGVNIRSGSHYEVVQVWDYNNDGSAEVALKTADGTTVYRPVYEDGQVTSFTEVDHIGCCSAADLPVSTTDAEHDYRETGTYYGHVISGPEYFTMFSGKDGSVIDTIDYEPERGDLSSWGDVYGNRGFRFLSATAYLDGVNPYFLQCRGYYERTAIAAYRLTDTDGDGEKDDLEQAWLFDTDVAGEQYEGQGNHGLAIADVDNDGKDEIIYGGLCLDHDGTVLYSTGLGHGDAMHVTDLVLDNPGQEVMSVHEETEAYYAAEVHDAETGEILMGMHIPGGIDLGRGVADDIDPTSRGGEWWTVVAPDYDATDGEPSVASRKGAVFSTESQGEDLIILANHASPASNAMIYWDGDLIREIQDKEWDYNLGPDGSPVSVTIAKWNYLENKEENLFNSADVWAHGTKGNMGIVADFLGDWREEFITMCSFGDFTTKENGVDKIRVYTTTIQTDYVIPCLMEDLQYLEALAWQNTGYNQPAHLSYMLSEGTITAQLSAKEVKYDGISFAYTEACDGTRWGHPVEGYEIYRAEVDQTTGTTGSYAKIATVGSDVLEYKDSDVVQGKTYSYAVAAVVDGKTSYQSRDLQITVPREIASVNPITLEDLIEGQDPEAALPKTVTIVGTDGVEEQAPVTWDLTGFDNNTPGEYMVYATVDGWSQEIEVTWKVIDKVVTSYAEPAIVKVLVGGTAKLPETVFAVYNDGDRQEVAVVWDTENLDTTKTGDYLLNGKVNGMDLVPTVRVLVVEDYVTSVEDIYVEIELGTAIEDGMPAEVEAEFVSGTKKNTTVVWDLTGVEEVGSYEVKGIVDTDFEVTAHVSVVYPAVMKFDFGTKSDYEEEGWIAITGEEKSTNTLEYFNIHYTEDKGYGFEDGTVTANGRTQNYTQAGRWPRKVYQDMALVGGQTFLVDLPKGTYVVEMLSGSADSNTINATVEGTSFKVSSAASAYASDEVEVEVLDGQLTIAFKSGTMRLNAIVVRAVNVLPEDDTIPVDSITLNQETASLYKGETLALAATVSPGDATDELTWTSSDESVATVSNGDVTAVGVGTATITVESSNGVKASCVVTVTEKAVVDPIPTATPVPTATPAPTTTPEPTTAPEPTATPTPVTQEEQKGVTYKVSGSGVTISKIDKNATSVTIPATITTSDGQTYKVTSIAKNAAKGNTKLTKVVINSNITSIGDYAFYGCKNLKSVTIGKNVVTIGKCAFAKNTSLTKITIPDKVKTIGANAFDGCTKLKTVKLGKSLTAISDKMFYKCTSLTKVTIPSKVTKIGKSAFASCTKLASVTIGKKVSSIGSNAFYKCTSLKKVTIPSSVKTIGGSAFSGCTKLATLTIGSKVATIDKNAFYKCSALKKVTIPASVKTIGANAFNGCKNLKSITIKTTELTTKTVGNKAFSGINAKATIKVPGKKLADYKTLLLKKGVKKTATIKK